MTQPPYQPHPPAHPYPQGPPPQYAEMQAYPPGTPYGYGPPVWVPASWSDRVGAYILDGVLLVAIYLGCSLIGAVLDPSEGLRSFLPVAVVVLGFALWNRVYLQSKTGQSLGKSALGIQLLHERTGRPPGVLRTLGRELLGLILGRIPLLGLVWALSPQWDSKKRAWHDTALGTIVVKRPKY